MQIIKTFESQGNKLHVYHGGYIEIVTSAPHFGFQVYPEFAEELIEAIRNTQVDYGVRDDLGR